MSGSGMTRSVVVTGASSGIGRATVAALLDDGFAVWAATRTEAGAEDVRAEFGDRVRTLVFDLTSDEEIGAAAAQVLAEGPLFGLANIAGAALPGPLEFVPIEQFQRQLDINVTGQLRVTQALLPALRAGAGVWDDARIVIMGSLDGRIVGPLFGPYAASKHALVGVSDALRAELMPSRIRVSLLEPGVIATPIWRRGTGVLGELQPTFPDRGGPYRSIMNFAQKYVSKLSDHGASASRVADAVVEALTSAAPSPRRVVGIDAKIVSVALRILPQRLIYRLTALPKLGSARRYVPPR
jgi:NAD(P)-dependent dehydrogenase (short-subunit alcohol dehydrogenase family)